MPELFIQPTIKMGLRCMYLRLWNNKQILAIDILEMWQEFGENFNIFPWISQFLDNLGQKHTIKCLAIGFSVK